jgi:para-nitrobenzyl esterase
MAPIANTAQGRVEGTVHEGVLRFAGIPFAKPPVGDLRFRPPQPADRWDGVRPAKSFGDTCSQSTSPVDALFGGRPEPVSEDCLYLNVWTPALDDGARPVMVWIHGGGFMMGSGSSMMYDGTSFARRGDVVFVSLNYRLAELGFSQLAHLDERYAGSGNCGILDQVAALEWVRDNIAAFGGDPGNVTIFGESAGGMSVATLMGTPAAAGLFHKAIPQSGAAHNFLPAKVAAEVTDDLMKRVNARTVADLVSIPAEAFLPPRADIIAESMGDVDRVLSGDGGALGLPWQPVEDGTVLPEGPLHAVRAGAAAGIPLLVGTTREEWKLFGLMMDPNAITRERVVSRASAVAGDGERFVDTYSADGRSAAEVFGALATDFVFRIPAIRLAEAQLAHTSSVWMYLFSWESRAFGGALGACHAMELPFVFHRADDPRLAMFLGEGPVPADLADQVQDAWISFARSGDPNTPSLPEWPAYDTDRRATMELAEPCRLLDDPASVERRLWDHLR